jgi:hypothetical protein
MPTMPSFATPSAADPVRQAMDAIERIQGVLGPVFAQIMRQPRQGPKAHRLATAVAEWRQAHEQGAFHVQWAVELDIAALVFERWSDHRIWRQELHSALVNRAAYPHALISLIAASEFGASPVEVVTGVRMADLLVPAGDGPAYRIEVKCPLELQRPRPNLQGDRGRKVVQACVSKASSRPGGQLDAAEPVVLTLGGFNLGPQEVRELVEGAERELSAVPRPNLAGIMLVHWYCVTPGVREMRGADLAQLPTVLGIVRKQWIPNPSRDGRLNFAVEPCGPDFWSLRESTGSN